MTYGQADVIMTDKEQNEQEKSIFEQAESANEGMFVSSSFCDGELIETVPQNMTQFKNTIEKFSGWNTESQVVFVQLLLQRMGHHQLGEVDHVLRPLMQRDFIAKLPHPIVDAILSGLIAKDLCLCESVSKEWRNAIALCQTWKKLIERKMKSNFVWHGLAKKRNWLRFFFGSKIENLRHICSVEQCDVNNLDQESLDTYLLMHTFYKKMYPRMQSELDQLDSNWATGNCSITKVNCRSETSKGVYCLQYDDEYIVSGLRDNTIKIWDRKDLHLSKTLVGHTGSVLCLQYQDDIIVSGSSDSTVRLWSVSEGKCLNTLIQHAEAVLHLQMKDTKLVTCSKDRTICIWEILSPTCVTLSRSITGHRAAVNVVEFDHNHIVTASGDRTIKVWTPNGDFIRMLTGHRRGIACLQYKDRLVASGSSDNTIRLWDVFTGACLRVLEGHTELVRCIRFDGRRIVSGAYDGNIRVWDMQAAINPRVPDSQLCVATLDEHRGRVFRLQIDDFQIVSSSHDDKIIVWNFLNDEPVAEVADKNTEKHTCSLGLGLEMQELEREPYDVNAME